MTVVRVLTPAGRGAIAVVEVAGPDAVAMVEARFEPAGGRPLSAGSIDAIRFGRWRATNDAGDSGEELVVVRTAEDRVEVHCHGGVAASAAIVAALSASGATTAASQAPVSIADDARRLLAEAPTERVAGLLLDQANGALEAAVGSALAAIESGDVEQARRGLERLLRHQRLALHGVVAPWRVVLAGPPNAGKSSLKNALVGYERAIVYDQPGTTRDVVATTTAIGGWPVLLSDTAGVRETDDPLEAAGVRLTEQALAAADVVVVVREADAFESAHAATARERLDTATPDGAALIDVASKADLAADASSIGPPEIATSVKTGQGLAELTAAIERAISPAPPAAGDAVPFRAEHVGRLRRAAERLPNDLAAAKAALQALLANEAPSV